MKRLFSYILVFPLLLSACTADMEDNQIVVSEGGNAKIINGSTGCVRGSIALRFDASAESRLAECATRSGATRTGIKGVDMVLESVNGYSVEPVFVVTEKNREKVHAAGLHLWYELHFDEDCNIDDVATRFADVEEVNTVQFVHQVCRLETPKMVAANSLSLPQTQATRGSKAIPFNDVYATYQWGFNNLGSRSKVKVNSVIDGQEAPIADADINVVSAWKLCTGDPSIVVAVVDEGIMNTHEDLKDNIWINKAELNGVTGSDDDGNGYEDDIYGYNFVFMEGEILWDESGDQGHGSHVAGIISAVNNNGKGVCGIAGGSGNQDGVKLMSIQIFSGRSGATNTNLARAMQYAADNGAHILQCSWGYLSAETVGAAYNKGPANDKNYKRLFSTEQEAIDYFIKNGGTEDGPIDGGLAIFAAGNDSAPLPCYPAAYEPCIAVAAFNPSLRPAYYTDYGEGTDISAPGGESLYDYGGILSTVPEANANSGTKRYGMQQGTSQACPHVSGVAALGLSYAKQLGKRYTAKEFRSLLLSATNDIEPYLTGDIKFKDIYGTSYSVTYPDYKGKMGSGYVDAYRLLLQIEGTPCRVIKVGDEIEVDLSLYFGKGLANAQFVRAEASAEDIAATGLVIGDYVDGKIKVSCSECGSAAISVTMLIGGGSLNDSNLPFPTEVTRTFVVISRDRGLSDNGGWL